MALAAPQIPMPVRTLVGALSLAVLVTGVAGVALSLGGKVLDPEFKPIWSLFGFEVVVSVSAVIGIVFGLGRFRQGPGMALACVSGAIFAASVLGYLSASGALAGVSLRPYLLARVAAAAVLAVAGGICVLTRHSRSWPVFFRGLALGAPVLAVGALAAVPAGRGLLASLFEAGALAQMAIVVVGALLLGGLLAASVHQIVRAFELGRLDEAAPGRGLGDS